jgi:hypothetical protein
MKNGHETYDLVPGDERNYARPFEPVDFNEQLASLTRGEDVDVRLVWAPDVDKYEVDIHGNRVLGKQYAVMPKLRQRGWFIGDIVNAEFVLERHSQPGEPCPARCKPVDQRGSVWLDPRSGKVWIRDSYVEQIAFPRWVIEQKIDDTIARQTHEKERFEWVNRLTGEPCTEHELALGAIPVRRDMLGEFPADGWWKAFLIIAEHKADGSCCKKAFPAFCYGWYRPPGEEDLLEVRKAIWYRNTQPMLHGKSEPPTAWEINEHIWKTMAEIEASEARADQQVLDMLVDALPKYSPSEIAFEDLGKRSNVGTCER